MDCGDPTILAGIAVADMAAFLAYVGEKRSTLKSQGVQTASERYEGTDIHWVTGRSPETGVYLAVHQGYLLVSTSRSGIVRAQVQDPQSSLAASPAFQDARGRFPGSPLAFLYANLPQESLVTTGGGLSQESPVQWLAGALNLGEESAKVDLAASLDPERLTPATRALLAKKANPLASARVVPPESMFFAGWDNLKLIWDVVVESNWPRPEDYQRFRQLTVRDTGLDPEDDIFGWMTGELGIFVAPTRAPPGSPDSTTFGLVLEARNPQLVRQKLDKIMDAIRRQSLPNSQPTVQEIDGVPFQRIPLGDRDAIYGTLVDNWLIVTLNQDVAAATLAAVRGQGGLARQSEYGVIRSALPDPLQFLGYVNVPEIVRVTTSEVGARGRSAVDEEAEALLRPIKGVGLAVHTTASNIDSTFFTHVVVPDEPIALPREERPRPPSLGIPRATLDISRHGGAWRWDNLQRDPRGVLQPRIGEGSPLQRFLLNQRFAHIDQVVFPGEHVGRQIRRGQALPMVIRPDSKLLVRVGSQGDYTQDELQVYLDYVRCGGVLLLLSDGKAPGETDALAEAFGLQAAGVIAGESVLDDYQSHPATKDVAPLGAPGGTGLLAMDAYTEPLGSLSAGTYLDLDGNEVQTRGEPAGAPALALRHYGHGSVVFLGTTSIVETPEHPLLGSLLRYLLPDSPRRPPTSALLQLSQALHDRAVALATALPPLSRLPLSQLWERGLGGGGLPSGDAGPWAAP